MANLDSSESEFFGKLSPAGAEEFVVKRKRFLKLVSELSLDKRSCRTSPQIAGAARVEATRGGAHPALLRGRTTSWAAPILPDTPGSYTATIFSSNCTGLR